MFKKNRVGGLAIPNFKTYFIATGNKPAGYWQKERHTDLWNIIKSPEIDFCISGQLIFNKGTMAIQRG